MMHIGTTANYQPLGAPPRARAGALGSISLLAALLTVSPRSLGAQATGPERRCAATGVLVGMVSRPPQGQAVSGAIVRLGPASAIAGAIASASSDQQGRESLRVVFERF